MNSVHPSDPTHPEPGPNPDARVGGRAGRVVRPAARHRTLGLVVFAIAGLMVLPTLAVISSLFGAADTAALSRHVWATTGPGYLRGTLILCALTAIGAGVIGTLTAMVVTLTDLPGKRLWTIALTAPFAVPAYIAAYVYGDLFSPFGAGTLLLGTAGLPPPPMRTMIGAAFILSLTTYPYVFLAVRASLIARSGAMLEAARAYGASPGRTVVRVILPLTRPAIAGGLSLVMMETAADFGVADFFGVPTLSTGIFRTWQGLGSLTAASQIAAGLFVVAILFMTLEEAGRRGRTSESGRLARKRTAIALTPAQRLVASIGLAIPVLFGVLVPLMTLAGLALTGADGFLSQTISQSGNQAISQTINQTINQTGRLLAARNTLTIAGLAALSGLALSVALAYGRRHLTGRLARIALRVATAGYALPGVLVAIGLLQALGLVQVLGVAGALPGGQAFAAMANGSLIMLLVAYIIRFMTAGYHSVNAGLDQVNTGLDEAARIQGAGRAQTVFRIHGPLMAPALIAAFIIMLIDVMKELPATLILRPFNFETLATRVYRLASDERLREAAPEALFLILAGFIPVLILLRVRAPGEHKRAPM